MSEQDTASSLWSIQQAVENLQQQSESLQQVKRELAILQLGRSQRLSPVVMALPKNLSDSSTGDLSRNIEDCSFLTEESSHFPAQLPINVPLEITAKLNELSQRSGASSADVLHAALSILSWHC
ncbi:MAG: hypothetical protein HC790_10850 [Acaryochloridaceae cyanobacterium CSU_3_4]|nr:hypothetical protein [Acaryochloridaceae cyanobacterium CSU_3_4]